EPEREVDREAPRVPRDGLVQHLGLDAIERSEIAIEHHAQTAHHGDPLADEGHREHRRTAARCGSAASSHAWTVAPPADSSVIRSPRDGPITRGYRHAPASSVLDSERGCAPASRSLPTTAWNFASSFLESGPTCETSSNTRPFGSGHVST